MRAELNAPLEQGRVSDDLRITTTIPTIEWLRERGAAVALATIKWTGSMIWPILTGTAAAWLVWALA